MAFIGALPRSSSGTFGQIKSGAKLALQHRRAVKNGELSVFFLAFVLAMAKDGIFDMVPFLGTIGGGFFITAYLFIFLWFKGKWKVRLVVAVLAFLDFIPGPNLLPMQTLFVWYAYHVAKQDAKQSKLELQKMENQEKGEVARDRLGYRMRRQRESAGEANAAAWETQRYGMKKTAQRTDVRSQPTVQSQPQNTAPQAESASKKQNQESRPMAPSLAANDGSYAGYKGKPAWMYDQKAQESADRVNERMAVAKRLGMDSDRAANKILDMEKSGVDNPSYRQAA